jgi:hypothetical protein
MDGQDTVPSKVINLADKRWENVFSNDLQDAFEQVMGVLDENLPPNVGKAVGLAIAECMYIIGDHLTEKYDDDEVEGAEIIFQPDWHEGHDVQPTRDH